MTTVVEPVDLHASRRSVFPTVGVAGVAWPLYKLQAVVLALLAGVVALGATGSGQITMWVSGATLVGVWWLQRYRTGMSAPVRPI